MIVLFHFVVTVSLCNTVFIADVQNICNLIDREEHISRIVLFTSIIYFLTKKKHYIRIPWQEKIKIYQLKINYLLLIGNYIHNQLVTDC